MENSIVCHIEIEGFNQRRILCCQVFHNASQTVPEEIDGRLMPLKL
jgi:hypothetical protein